MQLSSLVYYRNQDEAIAPRSIPNYVLSNPPLRSLPGVICSTSNIFEYILDLARRVTLKKGEIIYPDNEGQIPLCYLKKGKICSYNLDEEGNIFITHFLFYGVLVYDAFFLTSGQYKAMPIKVLEDSELYSFPADLAFEDLLTIHTGLVKNLLYSQSIKDLLYSKLFRINMKVKPLNRICSYLYEMYERYQEMSFCPNITQAEMALLLNMHTVTVSNVIKQLKEKNVLEIFTKKQIIIKDVEKLRHYRFYN